MLVQEGRSADCKSRVARRIRKSNETVCGTVFRQVPRCTEVKGVSGPEFQAGPAIPPPTRATGYGITGSFPGVGTCARLSQVSSGLIVWEEQHRMSQIKMLFCSFQNPHRASESFSP